MTTPATPAHRERPHPPAHTVTVLPRDRLSFGLQLPIQSQSTIYAESWEAGAGPAELAHIARACDEAGFFYVGVCDHTIIPERLAGPMSTTWYDTVATLGWLAGITERVNLLSHIYVVALRHPLRAAKEFATLDALSGGRVICGVGAGHVTEEFELLGVPFAERGRATDEAIVGLAAGLADEFPALAGPRWPASGVGLAPRPVRSPRPPIWVGGSSPAALARCALYGDGWLPQTVGPNAELVARLRELRAELRPGAPLDIGALAGPVRLGPAQDNRDLPRGTVVGSSDRLLEHFATFASAGVDQIQVRLPARSASELCDQIAAFGSEVISLAGR